MLQEYWARPCTHPPPPPPHTHTHTAQNSNKQFKNNLGAKENLLTVVRLILSVSLLRLIYENSKGAETLEVLAAWFCWERPFEIHTVSKYGA